LIGVVMRYLFVFVFLIFSISSSLFACDSNEIDEWMKTTIIPYCTDKKLCKDKKEMYVSDLVCAMSDYYQAEILSVVDVRSSEYLDQMMSKTDKSFVVTGYNGGGVEAVLYCENENGKCNNIRGFTCRSVMMKDGSDVCSSYYVFNKQGTTEFNIDFDEFLKFLVKQIPKDRKNIKHFGEIEVVW